VRAVLSHLRLSVGLELARCEVVSSLNRSKLQSVRIRRLVDNAKPLRLGRHNVRASQHERQCLCKPNELRKSLGSACTWEDAKHHLWETELSAGGLGAHTVPAPCTDSTSEQEKCDAQHLHHAHIYVSRRNV
jgi:hypothetical protein